MKKYSKENKNSNRNKNFGKIYFPHEKPEIIDVYKDPETEFTVQVLKEQYGVYLAQNYGLL